MKIYLTGISLILICFPMFGQPQQYVPVDQNSTVLFKVSHQMIFKSTVTGNFSSLKGDILFDPQNLVKSYFNVSVTAGSVNSGIGMRDNDLKKEKYFDVLKYPLIVMKSRSITRASGEDTYLFTGTLTMKGITKNISFPFTAKYQNGGYLFTGNFHLNRLDYNVGPDNSIDKSVEVDLSVLAK